MKEVLLSDFCDTGSGGTPSRARIADFYDNGTIPWVKSGELSSGEIFETEEHITEAALKESAAKLVKPGALLMAMYGATVGQVAKLGVSAATNQAICYIVPDRKLCNIDYLNHFLRSIRGELLAQRVGGGQPNISQGIIKAISVPLPPLTEQKRIAAILDKADAIRRKLQQSLRLSDDFLRSVFLDMFGDPVTNPKGWPILTIRDLLVATAYGTSKKASEAEGQFPCLRMNNITYSGGWNFTSLKYVDLDKNEQSKNLVHAGQLLFNRTNSKELVGKTAVYRRKEPMAFAGYLVRGIANDESETEYISAFLNLPHGKAILQGMCKNIIGMANINAEEFKSIRIAKPPVTLQKRFAKIVISTEQKKETLQKFLTEAESLFSSLQQRAFRGEL